MICFYSHRKKPVYFQPGCKAWIEIVKATQVKSVDRLLSVTYCCQVQAHFVLRESGQQETTATGDQNKYFFHTAKKKRLRDFADDRYVSFD